MTKDTPVIGIIVAPGGDMPPGLQQLRAEADVRLIRTQDEFDATLPVASAFAVYDFRTPFIRHANFAKAGNLKWLHAASAGVDAILVPGVVESDFAVTNSRGVFDAGIAEYVLGLMLLFAKDFHTTLAYQREQRWQHRESLLLRGRHLLVVGAGSIGTAIGRQVAAAGLTLDAVARDARADEVFGHIHATSELPRLLPGADFVVISAPLTAETRGLFDAAMLAHMRPGSWLINIGRGPIVVESALIEALERRQLAGAALDVFDEEPLPAGHPFWTMPNVVVSPHMAGDVVGWDEALGNLFVENVQRWLRGEALRNVVDKQRAAAVQDTGGAAS